MSRRAPLQKLRGSDPKLLEIQVQDLLNRPWSQLEPLNLLDLFALAEHPEVPKPIRTRLGGSVTRLAREIGDLPDGSAVREFVAEYGAVEAARVPRTFREHIAALAVREERELETRRGMQRLVDGWADTPPEPFVLGAGAVRVQRATAANAPESAAPRTRTQRAAERKELGASRTATPKAKPIMDIDRKNWIIEVVLARLAENAESGLAEAVLIAGIKHRARETYPNLAPQDITAVLHDLQKVGTLRKSAGRWSRGR